MPTGTACDTDIHGIGDWIGSGASFDMVKETELSLSYGT
jgi:hypothetical protein